ncbi:DEAD-box ATP-dependent RNA helicase [Actinidia chinensis var. chinensis]|uniref:RNA helicase n=1 Tax=Actinidia chinensis var. chinensis TaxID=1590841 RepID=A0A2R6PJF8_ACTCC|nr:DEAD-box ATP-dependent RNA helicase [Actinidia chinensis var. chinensis]
METAEPTPASLGPRYAPDDPTLPKPWKGLIDGSTGIFYYWNPETNITQYEKPSSLPPPLPPGLPPSASAPELAPIPKARMMQSNGVVGQPGHRMTHTPQQQGQQTISPQHPQGAQLMPQGSQPHSSQLSIAGQQQGSQLPYAMQQQGHLTPQRLGQQTIQQPNQQVLLQSGLQMPQQPVQQMPQQSMQQLLGQQRPVYQGSQMGQPHGHQFTHQQMQYMAYQQTNLPVGQQSSQQQTHHIMSGHIFPHQQEQNVGCQLRDDVDSPQGKQIIAEGTNSFQMQQMSGQSGQAQQFGNSSLKMQQPSSLVPLPQSGIDVVHQQHGPGFHNQWDPAIMHGQQPSVSPVNLKMGFEENASRRAGNEYYFNASNDVSAMVPQHPKLAAIPMSKNQQEMRLSGVPLQNVTPGIAGPNSAVGPALHNIYGHATGGSALPNNVLSRPPTMIMESSDAINLSHVEVYRQKHEVTATGGDVPAPFMTFEATGFPPEILSEFSLIAGAIFAPEEEHMSYAARCPHSYVTTILNFGGCKMDSWSLPLASSRRVLHLAGFASPTPIQAQTWPIALQNRDIVAIAKTGSGKTLGYLIPAFILLRHHRNNAQNGPTVLVLAPTRELATQIQNEVIKFGRSSRISCTCLYGGAPKGPQLKELDRGADIVVATPGRLIDILEMKKIDIGQVSLLVLDEADRMLDMGFEPQIRKIVNKIPPRRQTLMYTATWPKEVRKIASDLLVNPFQVNIGSVDELEANKSITQNRDIVAIAKTGSGKTLGYLIPAFILLRHHRNNAQNGPTVLVLAPTRELATQIQNEVIKFGRSSRISCTCLYGGAPKGPQLKELDRGADIVVATPGRLIDILEMKKIDIGQVSLLVLDEADRMLDMGFEPQIRKIVNKIPPRRQTLMYTATWPKEVRKIASDLLVNPFQVNIGSVDELEANKSITQYVEVVPHMEKQRRLEQILRSQERGSKVIIFCSTKRLCDQLARSIGRSFGAAVIHGDKSQGERDWVLNQFRSGKSPILVATDVAARGLDIKDIRVVINYDFPTGIEDYVHRIGRTGRAGATGVAYTFFSDQDWKYAADLVKVLEGANQQVPPEVREMALRGVAGFVKDRGGSNRFDSSGGVGGHWDSAGRGGPRDADFGGRGGMRDADFGGRGGMRENFGGRGGMRDGGFGGRGGMRDGGFGGRGGMRDGGFGGRGGMRDGGFGGRGGMRDGDFGGRGGGHVGWDRNDRGPQDRYNNMDGHGRGRGRGRGRFDNNRRDAGNRSRGRSCSSSPEWMEPSMPEVGAAPVSRMSPMSPGTQGNAFAGGELPGQLPGIENVEPGYQETAAEPPNPAGES